MDCLVTDVSDAFTHPITRSIDYKTPRLFQDRTKQLRGVLETFDQGRGDSYIKTAM